MDIDDEFHRRGHFEIIFPLKENIDKYSHLFEAMRYNNLLLWKLIKSDFSLLENLKPKLYFANV